MRFEAIAATTFGTVVHDVDWQSIDDRDFAELQARLDASGLLVFRGAFLDETSQARFARRFGAIEGDVDQARPIANRAADGTVLTPRDPTWLTLSYPTRYWHMDGTFNPIPPKVCLLSAVTLPATGSKTGFADLAAGYDALDDAIRVDVEGRRAFHSNLIGSTRVLPREHQQTMADFVGVRPVDGYYGLNYRADVPLRPLVRTHPTNGRKILMIGRHVFAVSGMSLDASEQFLADLEADACRGERVYDHAWQRGDLVVFDNRRVVHRVHPYDDQNDDRLLLNCRVKGDSVDAGLDDPRAADGVAIQHRELERLRRRAGLAR